MRAMLSVLSAFVFVFAVVTSASAAEKAEKRIAFVVGNESYAAGALPTAANDAGLIAQTLQAAGFEVIGARDLDAETLRQSYADFLKKVTDAGPDTVAFVYLAGYGVQYGNDNFYVPIGANVSRGADIPIATIRLSDLTGPLVALNLKARFMVFDAAYKLPFKIDGPALAGGLSLVDASSGSLVAYNAAPGTVAPVLKGNYGLYAQSLAAMLREGGLAPDLIFDRVRLRVNDESKGAEVPWDDPKVDPAFRFFDSGKNAPPPVATADQAAALVDKPLKDLPVQQAYTAAVARDSIESYSQFTAAYGGDPLAKRARVLLAARREAITWRRTISVDTPPAYWSYLSRYPRGPHAGDARLRLQELAAAEAPPPDYPAIVYDVPPPPPEEFVYFDRPAIDFDDPAYADYAPPPPPPDYWLPPVPVAFIDLPPPPPPVGLFFLPVPAFVPLPDYYDPPSYVFYPQNNYFYGGYGGDVPYDRRIDSNNIHRAFEGGGPHEGGAREGGSGLRGAAIGAAVGAAAVALPVAALARSNALRERGITTPQQLRAARTEPGGLNTLERGGPAGAGGNRNALPGAAGHALPAPGVGAPGRANDAVRPGGAGGPQNSPRGAAREGLPGAAGGPANVRTNALRPGGGAEHGRETGAPGARNAVQERTRPLAGQRLEQRREAPRAETRRAPEPRVQPHLQARPQVERAAPRVVAPRQEFRAPQGNPGGFGGGQRPGGIGGGAPAPRPGGFGGGSPRPGGFGGGGAPQFGGGARPGGFGGGGGAPHPGGFGGGGAPHPGGFGGGGAPRPAPGGGGAPGRPHF